MTASTSQSDAQLFSGAETHKAAGCQIVTGKKSQGGSGEAILNEDSKFVALHRGFCLKHKETNCKIGIRIQQILAVLPKDVFAQVKASQSSSFERAYIDQHQWVFSQGKTFSKRLWLNVSI